MRSMRKPILGFRIKREALKSVITASLVSTTLTTTATLSVSVDRQRRRRLPARHYFGSFCTDFDLNFFFAPRASKFCLLSSKMWSVRIMSFFAKKISF